MSANGGQAKTDVLKRGDLQLKRDVNRAFWKNIQVELTLTEFQIVDYLVSRAGQDVRYRELYDIVHGEGFAAGSGEIGFRANVRAFIKRIRQKIEKAGQGQMIHSIRGVGYRIREAGQGESDLEEGAV